MKNYVLYHGNCFDGFASALVAKQKLGDTAEYIPVSYGQPFPNLSLESGSHIYIIDFSYPAPILAQILNECPVGMTVLDHHKTAEADLQGLKHHNLDITFDMNESGATLAWKHFFPDRVIPAMIRYIRDRDLWLWELPWAKEISMALASYDFDFPTWEVMLEMPDEDYASAMKFEGAACLRLQTQMVDRMCRHAQWKDIGGHRVLVANATVFFSEVGEKLCVDNPDMPFAAYFSVRSDGKYQYGLRSRGGFDVSEVARRYGGGGHAAASGFVSDMLL